LTEKKGKLIAFIGLDGLNKNSQISRLANYLYGTGHIVERLTTCEYRAAEERNEINALLDHGLMIVTAHYFANESARKRRALKEWNEIEQDFKDSLSTKPDAIVYVRTSNMESEEAKLYEEMQNRQLNGEWLVVDGDLPLFKSYCETIKMVTEKLNL
jgi:hypothetical protein